MKQQKIEDNQAKVVVFNPESEIDGISIDEFININVYELVKLTYGKLALKKQEKWIEAYHKAKDRGSLRTWLLDKNQNKLRKMAIILLTEQ